MVQYWRESPARREPSLSDSGVVTFHHVTMHLLAPVPANLLFVIVSELSAPGGVFRPSAATISGEVFLRDIDRFSLLLGHSRLVFDDKYWTRSVLDNTVGGTSEQQTSEPGITM